MTKFEQVKKILEEIDHRGYKLERGDSGRYSSRKSAKPTGFRLWRNGLYTYYPTLERVIDATELRSRYRGEIKP